LILFTFGDETGLLDGLPLAGLLPAAALLLTLLIVLLLTTAALLLATLAALLFLLILIGHQVTPRFDQRITLRSVGTFLPRHKPMASRRFPPPWSVEEQPAF